MNRFWLLFFALGLTGCNLISETSTKQLADANFQGLDRTQFEAELSKYGDFSRVRSPENSRFWTYKDWVINASDCYQKNFHALELVADAVSICVKRGAVVEDWMTELNFYQGETIIAYHPEN